MLEPAPIRTLTSTYSLIEGMYDSPYHPMYRNQYSIFSFLLYIRHLQANIEVV